MSSLTRNAQNAYLTRCLWIVLALTVALGCGQSDQNETAVTHGSVTLNGQPYTQGGVVLFHPEMKCKMASGPIQSDGTYTLSTYSIGDGAAVGKHKVTVMPMPVETQDPDGLTDDLDAPPPSPFPRKYSSTTNSGLECEVKSGVDNEFLIEMKSK